MVLKKQKEDHRVRCEFCHSRYSTKNPSRRLKHEQGKCKEK